MGSISFGSVGASSSGDGASGVAISDELSRCQRQLGDWQACPSGKTPEGKKIIENLRARVQSLEAKIAVHGQAKSAVSAPKKPDGGSPGSALGSLFDRKA